MPRTKAKQPTVSPWTRARNLIEGQGTISYNDFFSQVLNLHDREQVKEWAAQQDDIYEAVRVDYFRWYDERNAPELLWLYKEAA